MVKYPSGSLAAFRKPIKKKENSTRRPYTHRKGVNFSDRGMTLELSLEINKND